MFKFSLIPKAYKILIVVGLLIVAFAGGAWQGSFSTDKGWQLKDTKRIEAEQKARLDAIAVQQTKEDQVASQIAAKDAAYQFQEVNHAKELEVLRRDLRSSTVRLYAKSAKPATLGGFSPATASGLDAQARCELDPTTADDLISITSDGDTAIRQLTALQDYIITILEK